MSLKQKGLRDYLRDDPTLAEKYTYDEFYNQKASALTSKGVSIDTAEVVECDNLCNAFMSGNTCKYCKDNYDVSKDFYKAKRECNDYFVTGYLVKSKRSGTIQGILTKSSNFNELAYINESTLTKVQENSMRKEFVGFVGEYSDGWVFETADAQYSSNVPAALDELLGTETQDGDKFKITIEKL